MDNTNTNTNTNTSKENVLPNIKVPTEFYVAVFIIVILIIALFLIYFKVNVFGKKSKSQQETTANVFIVTTICIVIFLLCITFLPNIKDLKKLFEQISSVTYAIIYTIGLVLFFGFVSPTIVNDYAYIILPILSALGIFLFFIAGSHSYVDDFNINYERIKSIILFFCLIVTFIIFYNEDPGGYITKYFGYTSVISIVIAVFAFLYLIIVLTIPDKYIQKSEKMPNFMSNFSTLTTYGAMGFLIFLVMITIMIATYSDNYFFDNKDVAIGFIVIVIIISIIWSILLGVNVFPEILDNTISTNNLSIFKRSLLALFGMVISGLIIAWLALTIQNYSGDSSITSLLLNIAIVIIILGLIYKIVNVDLPVGNKEKNALYNLVINIIFYIPCYFSGIFDAIGNIVTGKYSGENGGETGSILMLMVAVVLIIIYFSTPSVFNIINIQGGKQLVNKPVNTKSQYALGTYEELNGTEQFNYQFGISFWVFVHAGGSNMNPNYGKFTSLLSFGGKPNVLYNASSNTLMVTMMNTGEKVTDEVAKLIDFDENGNRILYTNTNFQLQKWNNILINYNGGVLDIFLNGELVKSNIGVVPYYTLDSLTIGENDGIEGGICNVVYFRQPLTTTNMYFLYNMVKTRTPPVLNESKTTIMVNDNTIT